MVRNFSVALAAVVLLFALLPRSSYASASSLTHKDDCLPDGRVQATFAWTASDPTALLQWVDLSTQDNGWKPGTFIGAGPFVGSAASYSWKELLPSTAHLVRINQQLANGSWDTSPTFQFQTRSCTAPTISNQTTQGGQSGSTSSAAVPGQDCFYRGPLPDALCTPGVIDKSVTRDNIQTTICAAGYADTVRPPASFTDPLKQQQMVLYGMGSRSAGDFVEDYLIPLELGGAPMDPRNLWPEPLNGPQNSYDKDVVEQALNRAVCGGTVPLQGAQRAIAGDWTYALTLLGLSSTPADITAAQNSAATGQSSTGSSSSQTTGQSSTTSTTSSQNTTQTTTPSTSTTSQVPPPPPPPPPGPTTGQTSTPPPIAGSHIWYASSAPNASVYYCDLDDGWKTLQPSNLLSFPTEAAVKAALPSLIKSTSSKC